MRRDELFARVSAGGDAAPLLHEFALHADRDPAGSRWSFRRDLGTTRLVVIDSRAGRVLAPGARDMLDAQEWSWLDEQLLAAVPARGWYARSRGVERGRLPGRLGTARGPLG